MTAKIDNLGKVLVNLNSIIAKMQYEIEKALQKRAYILEKWCEVEQSGWKIPSDELREDFALLRECDEVIAINERPCNSLVDVRDNLESKKYLLIAEWCDKAFPVQD